jgi:hypothetical protein
MTDYVIERDENNKPVKKEVTKTSANGGFDASKYLIKLPQKKKVTKANGYVEWETIELDYLPVAARVAWFRKDHPDWSIQTEIVERSDAGWALLRTTIKDETDRVIATAHKAETKAGFQDYLEKAETGSTGRALALCGYGTLYATELEEGERIVDTPQAK